MKTTLEFLLGDYSIAEFMDKYWEQSIYHHVRNNPDYYGDIVKMNDVDNYISVTGDLNNIKTTKGDTVFNTLNTSYPFNGYNDNATIILNQFGQGVASLRKLQRSIEKDFFCNSNINLYLTPANSNGFPKHHDANSSFIMQLRGKKKWRLYEKSIEFPRGFSDKYTSKNNQTAVDNAAFIKELTLNQGDLLYIPRGYVHEAMTTDSVSVHITLAIIHFNWDNVLTSTMEDFIDIEIDARKTIPIIPGVGLKSYAELEKIYTSLIDKFAKNKSSLLERVIKRMYKNHLSKPPFLKGQFIELLTLETITIDSFVEHRHELIFDIQESGDFIFITFHDKTVNIPNKFKDALLFVLGSETSVKIKDIPGQDNEAKVALIKQLVKEGFLMCNSL